MDEAELGVVALVAVGGALGSVLRYFVTVWLTPGEFPWGTAAVNISGSFALALLFFFLLQQGSLTPEIRALLFVGVLGGFTTMSTFTFETASQLVDGRWVEGAANIFLNVALCLAGAVLGRFAGVALGGA